MKFWVNDCKYESLPQISTNQLGSLYLWYTVINAHFFKGRNFCGSVEPQTQISKDITFMDDKVIKMLPVGDQFSTYWY